MAADQALPVNRAGLQEDRFCAEAGPRSRNPNQGRHYYGRAEGRQEEYEETCGQDVFAKTCCCRSATVKARVREGSRKQAVRRPARGHKGL